MVIVMNGLETERDVDLFFGPMSPLDTLEFTDDLSLPRLLVRHGFFKNNAQAKGSGFPHQIPEGFNEWNIGKKTMRRNLCILRVRE